MRSHFSYFTLIVLVSLYWYKSVLDLAFLFSRSFTPVFSCSTTQICKPVATTSSTVGRGFRQKVIGHFIKFWYNLPIRIRQATSLSFKTFLQTYALAFNKCTSLTLLIHKCYIYCYIINNMRLFSVGKGKAKAKCLHVCTYSEENIENQKDQFL